MEKFEISAGISYQSVIKCIDDYRGFLRKNPEPDGTGRRREKNRRFYACIL